MRLSSAAGAALAVAAPTIIPSSALGNDTVAAPSERITLGFIGMVMTYEACLQLSRVTGDYSQVGMQFIRLIVSDFGPTLTGMMLATRVGDGSTRPLLAGDPARGVACPACSGVWRIWTWTPSTSASS